MSLKGIAAPLSAEDKTAEYFTSIKKQPAFLRLFLQQFPKGGDLHNHLDGAVYAESYLEWAKADGVCIHLPSSSLVLPDRQTACASEAHESASEVLSNENERRKMINAMSMRSFLPYPNWSGHDHFFESFFKMAYKPNRYGDMIYRVAERAGQQNISYLELMITPTLPDIARIANEVNFSGDIDKDYAALMNSDLTNQLPTMIKRIRNTVDKADRKLAQGCKTNSPPDACQVRVRYLFQIIRTLPPQVVFAQLILGVELAKIDPRIVGINLVGPESSHLALRDYDTHMALIDFLYRKRGPINISLHAGELTLGLVPPKHLKDHIWKAIQVGHAKRIGHGVDIPYEDNSIALLKQMHDNNIAVEINLTSNDKILGITGDAHPIMLYRAAGVPMVLSTDDEGVFRIDLTHEYQRAVETYGFDYFTLKDLARASIAHSFLSAKEKALILSELEGRFAAFEARADTWPRYHAIQSIEQNALYNE